MTGQGLDQLFTRARTTHRPRGRLAPTPSGDLHLGNLRTFIATWLLANKGGGDVVLRVEDLDPSVCSKEFETSIRRDLDTLGITYFTETTRQSQRLERHLQVIHTLVEAGLTYQCFCSRKDIREAGRAPHGELLYNARCATLTEAQRSHQTRRPALRLRSPVSSCEYADRIMGKVCSDVDDFVIAKADGMPAYNLAIVVDDLDDGVSQVLRGKDLAPTTGRQITLHKILGQDPPEYFHIGMVFSQSGERLAKRKRDITLGDLSARGIDAEVVLREILASFGLKATNLAEALLEFEPECLGASNLAVPATLSL